MCLGPHFWGVQFTFLSFQMQNATLLKVEDEELYVRDVLAYLYSLVQSEGNFRGEIWLPLCTGSLVVLWLVES